MSYKMTVEQAVTFLGMTENTDIEVVNARINGASIYIEDHVDALDFMVDVSYSEGSGQGFTGYILARDYDRKDMDSAAGWHFMRILRTVGVKRWEDLKGQAVRVIRGKGWGGKILGLAHFIEDKAYCPSLEITPDARKRHNV